MTILRFQYFNIRGGRDLNKRLTICEHVKQYSADFVMLQECHALNEDLEIWNKSLGNGKCLFEFFKYKKCRSGNIAKTK